MQDSCEHECSLSDEAAKGGGWQRFLPGRRIRILLVDGDRATRRIVSSLLSQCGYEARAASGCAKAWNLLEHSDAKFDLVLADTTMSFLSRNDLLTNIMSSEAHKDVPVIMMSSQDSMEVVFKCLLRGAKDFLVKPLRRNELQNLWQHVWRKNHMQSNKTSCGSDAGGKKRKAESISHWGNFSSDNFSLSTATDASHGCEGESSCVDVNSGQQVSEGKLDLPDCWEQDTLGRGIHSSLSRRNGHLFNKSTTDEALERSAKAADLIGTMTKEPRLWGKGLKLNFENPFGVSPFCQPLPGIEFTSRRKRLTSSEWCDLHVDQGVHQSPFSAFSKCATKQRGGG